MKANPSRRLFLEDAHRTVFVGSSSSAEKEAAWG